MELTAVLRGMHTSQALLAVALLTITIAACFRVFRPRSPEAHKRGVVLIEARQRRQRMRLPQRQRLLRRSLMGKRPTRVFSGG